MRHLTPEELADVEAVAEHAHLRGCDRCRAEWEEQRAVRDVLRGLPGPGALPADVARDLALALERLSPDDVERPHADRPRGAHLGEAAPTSRATVVPLSRGARRDPRERARPWLAAAAAVVVFGGGGAALVTHPWSSDAGDSSSSTAGTADKASGGGLASDAVAPPVYASGTSYERASLSAEVRERLLSGRVPGSPQTPAAGLAREGADDRRLATPEALASCLAALDVDAGHVAAVDLAAFQGEPAALIVVRDDAGGQDVWVVGRGCRQGDDQTRYFARVD